MRKATLLIRELSDRPFFIKTKNNHKLVDGVRYPVWKEKYTSENCTSILLKTINRE